MLIHLNQGLLVSIFFLLPFSQKKKLVLIAKKLIILNLHKGLLKRARFYRRLIGDKKKI